MKMKPILSLAILAYFAVSNGPLSAQEHENPLQEAVLQTISSHYAEDIDSGLTPDELSRVLHDLFELVPPPPSHGSKPPASNYVRKLPTDSKVQQGSPKQSAGHPKMADHIMRQYDANHDFRLSRDELDSMFRSFRNSKRAHM